MSINTNINALRALKRLDEASSVRSQTFERLSSGMRINRAGDDAAGLSIAMSLNADARVYSQAVRNINDGISFLNIADGATQELKNVLFRLRELATQSSNGTLSNVQRASLDKEAQALQSEYNRVVETARFNGTSVFGEAISVQAGAGHEAMITVGASTAGTVAAVVGDGTFKAGILLSSGSGTRSVVTADFNGDGILDLATADNLNNVTSVYLGNGDGTFKARRSYASSNSVSIAASDFNGDGILDLVTAEEGQNTVSVLLGNGDGTFQLRKSFYLGGGTFPPNVVIGDFNGDGTPDLAVAEYTSNNDVRVLIGNGNGTFKASTSFAAGDPYSIAVADLDGDGILDLVTADYANNTTSVLIGNGNGTFKASKSFAAGAGASSVALADFNGDGILDLVTADRVGNTTTVLLGNGNGTFKAGVSFTTGTGPYSVTAADMNGDGVLDLVTADNTSNTASVLFGNGDGTFKARKSFTTGAGPYSIVAADFNGDGVLDLVTANNTGGTTSVLLGNGVTTSAVKPALTPLTGIGVASQGAALAAQSRIDSYLNEVNVVSASIGAGVSRLLVASANLQTKIVAVKTASSRITDVDVAEESSRLVSTNILQQSASAVLSHALKEPELALKLLQFSE